MLVSIVFVVGCENADEKGFHEVCLRKSFLDFREEIRSSSAIVMPVIKRPSCWWSERRQYERRTVWIQRRILDLKRLVPSRTMYKAREQ